MLEAYHQFAYARRMLSRTLGSTEISVSALGLGAGQLGDVALDDAQVERLLNGAVDAGVTLIDTARGYGASEDRIGRHLGHRRRDFVLSTKVGYGIAGFTDWTGACITAGIDEALRLLRTDFIDIVHLHSCPIEVMSQGEITRALDVAVTSGKVRVAAYSGDNEALNWALTSGHFGSLQTSINLFDQRVISDGLRIARERGLGVIAKRPIGNAPWRFIEQPRGDYCETYWLRMCAMGIDPRAVNLFGIPFAELALRFTAFLPGVSSCIVGTRHLEHFHTHVKSLERGPLSDDIVAALRASFAENDDGWIGQT